MKAHLRHILYSLALVTGMTLLSGCGNSPWGEIPDTIADFVSEYFDGGSVESYVEGANGYTVRIKGGATLTFGTDQQWTDINGNGGTLPQMFLYDCLPSALYGYLDSHEEVNDVYRVHRSFRDIQINLSDGRIDYNPQTGQITGQ